MNFLKKQSLDSLIGYTFTAFLLLTLLMAFIRLPSFLYDIGQIIQTVLGGSILIGIVIAFGSGLVKIIRDKKVESD